MQRRHLGKQILVTNHLDWTTVEIVRATGLFDLADQWGTAVPEGPYSSSASTCGEALASGAVNSR